MRPYGWAGKVSEFLATPVDEWLAALREHVVGLLLRDPSDEQEAAWLDEYAVLATALAAVVSARAEGAAWSLVFEYELPLEGGRRADVIVLTGAELVVLEFKSSRVVTQADVDQAAAYARDLADYHKASRDLAECSYVVATKLKSSHRADEVILSAELSTVLLASK